MGNIVAIVGMCGAGKSVAADVYVSAGYQFLRFGQVTLDILKERGLEVSEDNERSIREEVREKHGMGAFAVLNIPKLQEMLRKGNVVIDGLYSWSEYKLLKEEFGDTLEVVAIYTPPQLRYERLEKRSLESTDTALRNRPITTDKAQKRDYTEIERIEKGGPIAMADITIDNIGTLAELQEKIGRLV